MNDQSHRPDSGQVLIHTAGADVMKGVRRPWVTIGASEVYPHLQVTIATLTTEGRTPTLMSKRASGDETQTLILRAASVSSQTPETTGISGQII